MGDILLINSYDQPLLQLKGQRIRRPRRKAMLNCTLASTGSAEQTREGCFRGLWLDTSPQCLGQGTSAGALTTCLSGAVLLRLLVTKQLLHSLRGKQTFLEGHSQSRTHRQHVPQGPAEPHVGLRQACTCVSARRRESGWRVWPRGGHREADTAAGDTIQ